jgi:hypothetical protein
MNEADFAKLINDQGSLAGLPPPPLSAIVSPRSLLNSERMERLLLTALQQFEQSSAELSGSSTANGAGTFRISARCGCEGCDFVLAVGASVLLRRLFALLSRAFRPHQLRPK